MRLIDADELNNLMGVSVNELFVKCWLDRMPTIDAVPVKQGKWEQEEVPFWIVKGKVVSTATVHRCSVCELYEDKKTKYCPNCGARMDGDLNG